MIDGLLLTVVVSVPAFLLIAFTVADVVRRSDLSTGRTVLWLGIVVILPVIGTLVYLLGRPLRVGGWADAAEDPCVTRLLDLLDQSERGSLAVDELRDTVLELVEHVEDRGR